MIATDGILLCTCARKHLEWGRWCLAGKVCVTQAPERIKREKSMHTVSRQFTILGVSALSGMLIVSGCATKKYVREQTGTVDTKVTSVSGKLTEVDNRGTRERGED